MQPRLMYALALAGALSACGRLRFDDLGTARDGATVDGAPDAPPCTFGPWTAPTLETAVNAAGATDWGPSMTNDQLVLVFASDRGDGSSYILQLSQRQSPADPWPTPTPIMISGAPVTGQDPQITDDGLTLLWSANGVIEASTRTTRGDAFPAFHTFLGDGLLYTEAQAPNLSADGKTLYFTASVRPSVTLDMFVTHRDSAADGFPDATHIPGLDDTASPQFGSVDAAGLDLVFQTGSNYEVFEATRATASDPFSAAAIPSELASSGDTVDASLTSDGRTLWFASTRASSDYDLFMTTRPCT